MTQPIWKTYLNDHRNFMKKGLSKCYTWVPSAKLDSYGHIFGPIFFKMPKLFRPLIDTTILEPDLTQPNSCPSFPPSLLHSLETLSNLKALILANNSLLGSIPAPVGDLSLLVELNVRFNPLSGPLPEDLRVLRNLHRLDVENIVLFGPVPLSFFSGLTQLQFVVLGYNNFGRVLPNATWRLPKLQLLDVSSNNSRGLWRAWCSLVLMLLLGCSISQTINSRKHCFRNSKTLVSLICPITILRAKFWVLVD